MKEKNTLLSKTACFSGHQDIPPKKMEHVRLELRREIESAIHDGYENFISGFNDGCDQMAAALVLEQQRVHPQLHLEAVLPYRGRLENLLAKAETHALLDGCSIVAVRDDVYSPDGVMARNRYMVQNASRLIAVYDGRDKDDTVQILRFAHIWELDIRVIRI